MPTKRKAAVVSDKLGCESHEEIPGTSRMLRGRVVPKHEYTRKKRCVVKRSKVDFSHIVPILSESPFFKLPRELRDEVYQWLWPETRIWQRYKGRRYIVTYGDQGDLDSTEGVNDKARWLLTSKQMLLEGLAEFHRQSIWIFESWGKKSRSRYVFPLITPTHVHEHHLYVNGAGNAPLYNDGLQYFKDVPFLKRGIPGYPLIITPTRMTMELVDLMTDAGQGQNRARKVRMVLQINDRHLKYPRPYRNLTWRPYHLPNVMFDFSEFDRLAVHKHMEVFEVEIQVSKNGMIQSCVNLDVAMANLMTELDIVGKALVPDGKCLHAESMPGWPIRDGVKCFNFVIFKGSIEAMLKHRRLDHEQRVRSVALLKDVTATLLTGWMQSMESE